jgi:hypothetical protein
MSDTTLDTLRNLSDASTRSAFSLGALWADELRGNLRRSYTVEEVQQAREAAVRFKPLARPEGAKRVEYRDGEFHFVIRAADQPPPLPQKRSWWTRLFHRLSS